MLAVIALLFSTLAAMSDAGASSRLCRNLEARLASAGTDRGSPARARQYENALADQRRHIARVEDQMRRAGCSGIVVFGGSGNACLSLRATRERMTANLATLERRYSELAAGGRSPDRARLLASLEANGCRDRAPVRDEDRPMVRAEPSILERLFGTRVPEGRLNDEIREPEEAPGRQRVVIRNGGRIEILPRHSGTFRTLCVRTCDGYFFPVAYSTPAEDLDRDAAACQAQCPGTEVALFIHRPEGEEVEDMVSLAGVPYSSLPAAYRYREAGFERPAGCGCGAPRNFSIIAGDHSEPRPTGSFQEIGAADGGDALHRLRGRPATAGDPMQADPAPTASITALPPPGERKVRVVGPTFLPDPEGAIDLRAPGRTLVR